MPERPPFPGYQNMISHAKAEEIEARHAYNLAHYGATDMDCRVASLRDTDTFDQSKGFHCRYQLHWATYLGWKVYMLHTGCFASLPAYESEVAAQI